ncbi:MAG: hypothetical protein KGI27_00990 [Thaumarchaeota archaeon]|nr:hypothetical protein [Nitrososphaerota archaeon]
MMEQDKKSIKTRLVILAILSAVFIPVSIGWYDTLDSHCKQNTSELTDIRPLSGQNDRDCHSNYDFHWAVFFGVNGVIFGLPIVAFVLVAKKNRKH